MSLVAGALALSGCKEERASAPEAPAHSAAALTAYPTGLEVYAASSEVRVIDPITGQVTASLPLHRAVRDIRFTPDGARAFIGCSAGLFEVDALRGEIAEQLTTSPVSQLRLDDRGEQLFVLEHDVNVMPDGTRELLPYRLRNLNVATRGTLALEEVGQRITSVVPSENGKHHLLLTEAGLISLGAAGSPLVDGERVRPNIESYRVRSFAVGGGRAFVGLEGDPSSEILTVDLARGTHQSISLPGSPQLRAVAATQDGTRVVAIAEQRLLVLDGESGAVQGTLDLAETFQGLALSPDGRFAFLMRTVDGMGGSVSWVQLDPPVFGAKILLEDISPWVIAVRPSSQRH